MKKRAPHELVRDWAKAMIEYLDGPSTKERLQVPLQVVVEATRRDDNRKWVLDV